MNSSRPMSTVSADPPADSEVLRRLAAVRGRLRRCVVVEGLAWMLLSLAVGFSVQVTLDYGARGVRWSMRLTMLLLLLAGTLWVGWRRLVRPLLVETGPVEVAHLVERRYTQLKSVLLSAVRFHLGEVGPVPANSRELMASVMGQASRAIQDLDFSVLVNGSRARRSGIGILVITALVTGFTWIEPEFMGLCFARNVMLREWAWARRTRLVVEVQDGVLMAARGDDVVIRATAEGVQPRSVELFFETASGQRGREGMVIVGNPGQSRYRYTWKNAQEDWTFYLRGGDDETGVFTVRLVDRPRTLASEMRIRPPPYTRGAEQRLGDGQRAAQVLPGSDVVMWVTPSKPLSSASLVVGETAVEEASYSEGRWSVRVSPTETQTYHFALVDETGLEDKNPARFALRVVPDDPPSVRLRLPGVGEMITPEAVLPIQAECADLYGLATAEVRYEITREGTVEQSLGFEDFAPYATTFSGSLNWPVTEAGLVPGERLTLRARASDFDDVSGPNVSLSPPVTLRLVTRDELLAELSRREQSARADFERLIDAQERIRGDALSLRDRADRRDVDESWVATLAALERRQRGLIGSVNVIRQQFEQNLGELRVNQLDSVDVRERLELKILAPLTQLTHRGLPAAADSARAWARADAESSTGTARRFDEQVDGVLKDMRGILETMVRWEGYHEVVSMLRDIMLLQDELRKETKQAAEREADEIFRD